MLGIRGVTFLLVPFALVYWAGLHWNLTDCESTRPFDFIVAVLFEVALYGYLYHHFADLRRQELAAPNDPPAEGTAAGEPPLP